MVSPVAILPEQIGDALVVLLRQGSVEFVDYIGSNFIWVDRERRAGLWEFRRRDIDGARLNSRTGREVDDSHSEGQ